jgi:hypothetical protein
MLRFVLLVTVVLSMAPAGAMAAIGQVDPLTVRGYGYDDCVQATGRPGELALPSTDGVRFAQATREGLKAGPPMKLAKRFECGSVVSRANGAGVIAGAPRDDGAVVVSVREPGGGAWSAPVTIALEEDWRVDVVRAAVSDRGDVIVSWRESRFGPNTGSIRRVRVVRRSPGGAFGAVEPLGEVANRHELVLPAIAGTGEAFVLTTTAEGSGSPSQVPLRVWSAGPGAAFGAPGTVGSMRRRHAPALAAAADGRVLVAWSDGASLHVTEREPGGTFAAPVRLGDADEPSGFAAGVTVGAAGEAAVGWQRFGRGDVQIASRRTPGAFSSPTRVAARGARADGDPFFASEAFQALYFGGGTLTYDEHSPNPVLTAGGRAALAWLRPERRTPALTSAPIGGGAASSAYAGRALDSVEVVQGLALADGTPAIAWTEPVSEARFRLHLAAEGVQERPQPAPPRVTFGAPRSATLSQEEPLRLPVSCSRPCVVFAGLGDPTVNGEFVSLPRGGRGELKIDGAAFFAPRPAGPVKLTVSYRSPEALRARSRTVHVRIARGADVPHPRVTDLRAVRRGESIRISWRVSGPIAKEKWPIFITADSTRAAAGEPVAVRLVEGNRRRYTVTLRAGADARYVTVRTALEGSRSVVRIG